MELTWTGRSRSGISSRDAVALPATSVTVIDVVDATDCERHVDRSCFGTQSQPARDGIVTLLGKRQLVVAGGEVVETIDSGAVRVRHSRFSCATRHGDRRLRYHTVRVANRA